MSYFGEPLVKDYADCERMFSTCRDPKKGKPIRTWCRLFKNQDVYELKYTSWGGKTTPSCHLTVTVGKVCMLLYLLLCTMLYPYLLNVWVRVGIVSHTLV